MGLPIISNTLTKVSYCCVEIWENLFFVQNVVKRDWKKLKKKTDCTRKGSPAIKKQKNKTTSMSRSVSTWSNSDLVYVTVGRISPEISEIVKIPVSCFSRIKLLIPLDRKFSLLKRLHGIKWDWRNDCILNGKKVSK